MALDALKKNFTACALAAGITATATIGAAFPAVANDQPSVQPVAAQPAPGAVKFGQHDVRGQSEAGIVSMAVFSSANSVSLVVRTTDKEVWGVAYHASKKMAESGMPVSLVLAGDDQNRLEIWTGGIRAHKLDNPVGDETYYRLIQKRMRSAHDLGLVGKDAISKAPSEDQQPS